MSDSTSWVGSGPRAPADKPHERVFTRQEAIDDVLRTAWALGSEYNSEVTHLCDAMSALRALGVSQAEIDEALPPQMAASIEWARTHSAD